IAHCFASWPARCVHPICVLSPSSNGWSRDRHTPRVSGCTWMKTAAITALPMASIPAASFACEQTRGCASSCPAVFVPYRRLPCPVQGEAMLLVLDVGNTNTVLGVYEMNAAGFIPKSGARLIAHWRVATIKTNTVDEYGVLFRNLFAI